MTTTKQQTQNYFELLIQLQPETAVEILMNLYSREINVEEWINNTSNDITDILLSQRIDEAYNKR
jgi:hypothetical protein